MATARQPRLSAWLGLIFWLVGSGVGVGDAVAQELVPPEARQGYYIGGGYHGGVSTAEGVNVGSFGTMVNHSFWLRIGEKPLPWLGLGLTLMGAGEGNEDWSFGYGGLQLEGQVEPWPDLDLAFRVATGFGAGRASRADPVDETPDDPDFAFGPLASVGLSYELFPAYNPKNFDSGGFGISFFLEGRLFAGGDVTSAGGMLGVEFTWWTGLDKRKLELPVDKAFE